jgi:hypothetical protein
MTDEELKDILDPDAVFEDPAVRARRELKIMAAKCRICGEQAVCVTNIGDIYLCGDSECWIAAEASDVTMLESS